MVADFLVGVQLINEDAFITLQYAQELLPKVIEVIESMRSRMRRLLSCCAAQLCCIMEHKCDKLDSCSIEACYLSLTHDKTVHWMWVPGSHTTTMNHNIVFIVEPLAPTPAEMSSDDTPASGPPVHDLDDQLEPGTDETVNALLLDKQGAILHCIKLDTLIADMTGGVELPALIC